MEKKFIIKDIIVSDDFAAIVCENIDQLHRQRKLRPQPKQGFYYKRDWYDIFTEESILNATYFISNIHDILLKKSNLPSLKRNVILSVCNKSLNEYVAKYADKKMD